MRWTIRARSRTVNTPTETPAVVNPSHPLAILDVALALRKMVERVTPEEFNWQDAHYDYYSEQGRELLFLIANHEWVRATSEIVDVVRSDVIDTTIKTDIDLSRIKHEAFRGRSGRVWLPIAVLPPQDRQRQVEPDLFATVADAAGNLLPLLPADDLGHQMSAALAEIIVNMAVAHAPNRRDGQLPGDQESRPQVRPVAARDHRVLLSAAIYRLLRREPRRIGLPVPASAILTPADAAAILHDLAAGRDISSSESGFSGGTFRISEARTRLLGLLDGYTVYLAKRASPKDTKSSVPDAEFVPELAQRAIQVLQALAASTIVVVPVNFDTEPTVLTVRVPTRTLKPAWKKFSWRHIRTWRISPRSWLIRPSGHLRIDVLLPTADADRQIQIRLADGVSFELPATEPSCPGSPLPRLEIKVKTPQPLLDLAASVRAVFATRKPPWPPSLTQSLVDLAQAKTAAASHALEHYQLAPGPGAAPPPDDQEPDDRKKIRDVQRKLEHLRCGLPAATVVDNKKLASLRHWWEQERLGKLALYRRASVDQFDPRTVVARVDMIEDVAQRATPEHARVYADVNVDDRGYFSVARASTLMSLLLMTGVLAFLLIWHLANNHAKPVPEVLAIVLTLFVTIQAGRIDRPDRSTLHGQLSGTGSLLIAASVFPAVTLAVALAFEPAWWVADIWAGVCVAVQAGFVGLTLWGPLTVIRSPSFQRPGRLSVGQRRKYETEHLYYDHFEALRSDYWRNTTADALMTGRPAYGYLITQNTDNPKDPASSTPPKLEDLLRPRGEPGAAEESSSVLALLHSSTQCRGVTFVVFRGKAADNPSDDRLRRLHIHDMKDLHLDADRLAPADNVSSTVDLFVGVDRHALPSMAEHPLIKVLQAAKNKLITLEAQLPVPAPTGAHLDRQWARVRVALRDTKDIHRLTEFLDEIYQNVVVPDRSGDLIAVQATPSAQSRAITDSPTDTAQDGQAPQKALLWGGDLDVSAIPAIADEPDDARTWHQIAIYADARSNIESEITQCLPADYQHYQLAHLNYAVLHGTAEIILLLHKTDWRTSESFARRWAGTLARRWAAPTGRRRAPAAAPEGKTELSGGQPHMVIDKNVSLRQLGPLTQHPLLRIRYRAQDRPGAFLNIVQAIGEFLEKESPPIPREHWSISFARLQVATGQIALGHLTIRLHDVTQDRQRWNSGKTEQMAREVSARAGLLATVGEQAGPPRNPDGTQDPVVRVDFVSKDPPHQPTRSARGKRTAPGTGVQP